MCRPSEDEQQTRPNDSPSSSPPGNDPPNPRNRGTDEDETDGGTRSRIADFGSITTNYRFAEENSCQVKESLDKVQKQPALPTIAEDEHHVNRRLPFRDATSKGNESAHSETDQSIVSPKEPTGLPRPAFDLPIKTPLRRFSQSNPYSSKVEISEDESSKENKTQDCHPRKSRPRATTDIKPRPNPKRERTIEGTTELQQWLSETKSGIQGAGVSTPPSREAGSKEILESPTKRRRSKAAESIKFLVRRTQQRLEASRRNIEHGSLDQVPMESNPNQSENAASEPPSVSATQSLDGKGKFDINTSIKAEDRHQKLYKKRFKLYAAAEVLVSQGRRKKKLLMRQRRRVIERQPEDVHGGQEQVPLVQVGLPGFDLQSMLRLTERMEGTRSRTPLESCSIVGDVADSEELREESGSVRQDVGKFPYIHKLSQHASTQRHTNLANHMASLIRVAAGMEQRMTNEERRRYLTKLRWITGTGVITDDSQFETLCDPDSDRPVLFRRKIRVRREHLHPRTESNPSHLEVLRRLSNSLPRLVNLFPPQRSQPPPPPSAGAPSLPTPRGPFGLDGSNDNYEENLFDAEEYSTPFDDDPELLNFLEDRPNEKDSNGSILNRSRHHRSKKSVSYAMPIAHNVPRQAPSPSNSQQSQQTNGIPNNGGPSGHPATLPNNNVPHAGHQTDINFLWSVVQELSDILAQNRSQTAGIIGTVQQIQARAREQGSEPSLDHVNGELNASSLAAELAETQARLHASNREAGILAEEYDSVMRLLERYANTLNAFMPKIRDYAGLQARAVVETHKYYNEIIEREREANLQLRIEHGQWQQGLGRATDFARKALRERAEETSGLESSLKEVKAENRILRRLVGWKCEDDSDDEGATQEREAMKNRQAIESGFSGSFVGLGSQAPA